MNPIQQLEQLLNTHHLWEEEKTYARNSYLVTKGTVNTQVFFITAGSCRVFIHDEEEEKMIRFGYKDSFIVALDSYISNKPTMFYMQAIKQCRVKTVSKLALEKLLQQDLAHTLLWQQILQALVYQQLEREVDILITSPLERYNRVFTRSPQLFQEIPHKYIASYLRMTPETLSRLKKS
ncbi:Crp/Fnr family transcriptional regulator [Terrimonas rubra]|uniref:Crp/Fnr family transcriptional regulator n=1 Tax=Terrimonas rubra TaxID=1035890 RepID=A0ABW6A1K4_9BACT